MPTQYVHWYNYYAYTYLILKKDTDIKVFNAKIKDFIAQNGVQAGGRIEYVRPFFYHSAIYFDHSLH